MSKLLGGPRLRNDEQSRANNIRLLVAEIRRALESHPGGQADPEALLHIRCSCTLLRRCFLGDIATGAKLGQVEEWGSSIYTKRKQKETPDAFRKRIEAVCDEILASVPAAA